VKWKKAVVTAAIAMLLLPAAGLVCPKAALYQIFQIKKWRRRRKRSV